MCKILLLEDDVSLIDGLVYSLERNGFSLDVVRTVKDAENYLSKHEYDLLLLDVTLPDGTGFEVCEQVRKIGSDVPIIFLTAADEEINVIRGLDSGGDDYITKPFKLSIFLSRVNALLRRSGNFEQPNTELSSNNIKADLLTRKVYKSGTEIELTASEYKLLCLFMQNPNIVLSPEQILSRLWDCDENYIDNSTLTVYIRRLRKKIEDDPSDPQNIVTVRRMGYKWSTKG